MFVVAGKCNGWLISVYCNASINKIKLKCFGCEGE